MCKKITFFSNELKEFLSGKKLKSLVNKEREELLVIFEDFSAYRVVSLDKNGKIKENSFTSKAEKKIPFPSEDSPSLGYYGCSLFKELKELKNKLRVSPKNKIAYGPVSCQGGFVIKSKNTSHVDWFLLQGFNPVNQFQLIEEEETK